MAASQYDLHDPMRALSLYPKIGQPDHTAESTVNRHCSCHQTPAPAPSSCLGIRVAVKPELRLTPPPQLAPQVNDTPKSNFQYDFELERKFLAEVENGSVNWSTLRLENLPSKTAESTSSPGSTTDLDHPVISKYIASGLNREVVTLAVANHRDYPIKVREFAKGTLLKKWDSHKRM